MTGVRLGPPVTIGDLQLVPIERTHVDGARLAGGIVATATKRPVALVIRSPQGSRVIDLQDDDETPVDYSELVPKQV